MPIPRATPKVLLYYLLFYLLNFHRPAGYARCLVYVIVYLIVKFQMRGFVAVLIYVSFLIAAATLDTFSVPFDYLFIWLPNCGCGVGYAHCFVTVLSRKWTRMKSFHHRNETRIISRLLSTTNERHVDRINLLKIGSTQTVPVILVTTPSVYDR